MQLAGRRNKSLTCLNTGCSKRGLGGGAGGGEVLGRARGFTYIFVTRSAWVFFLVFFRALGASDILNELLEHFISQALLQKMKG
jgi:hypothetical protein